MPAVKMGEGPLDGATAPRLTLSRRAHSGLPQLALDRTVQHRLSALLVPVEHGGLHYTNILQVDAHDQGTHTLAARHLLSPVGDGSMVWTSWMEGEPTGSVYAALEIQGLSVLMRTLDTLHDLQEHHVARARILGGAILSDLTQEQAEDFFRTTVNGLPEFTATPVVPGQHERGVSVDNLISS